MAIAFTNTGRAWLCTRLGGSGVGSFASVLFFVGWGNGSGTPATTSDTALAGEAATARAAMTATAVTTAVAGDTLQLVADLVAEANHTIDNAGVLDASAAGNLFLHANFPAISVVTGDRVSFTFTLQVA